MASTQRVLREGPAGTGAAAAVSAARNEWRGFQILMRSDAPVAGVTLEPGDLVGPGGATIPASTARLYREHQFQLTVGSYRNKDFRPGWYPDALIPFRNPLTNEPLHGARFTAEPFDLPANETHGFWVDLFVPADAKPGTYKGAYHLRAAGGKAVTVPVTLTVWNFVLPETPTLTTSFGSPLGSLRAYYKDRAKDGKVAAPKDWSAVEAQYNELLSRHRINAMPDPSSCVPQQQPGGSFVIPTDQVDALRKFVDRYHINALRIPHPSSVIKDPDAEHDKLDAWLKAWDRAAAELNRPQVLFYVYLKDEPNDAAAYQYVQKWGAAVRAAKSVVKVLVVEQTWPQDPAWGDLYGDVDIWCPLFSLFKAESAEKRQALGETVWTYTALCQGNPTPWWETDFPLLNYRVPAWIAWRYRMRGLLYWGGLSFWRQAKDPWTNPDTLDRRTEKRKDLLYNGEGSLLYPGADCGYDGIAPSLRLKALRDSIEDYEYLAMLEHAGKADAAQKIVQPLAESWFQWNPDPAAYDKARAELARLITGAGNAAPQ